MAFLDCVIRRACVNMLLIVDHKKTAQNNMNVKILIYNSEGILNKD